MLFELSSNIAILFFCGTHPVTDMFKPTNNEISVTTKAILNDKRVYLSERFTGFPSNLYAKVNMGMNSSNNKHKPAQPQTKPIDTLSIDNIGFVSKPIILKKVCNKIMFPFSLEYLQKQLRESLSGGVPREMACQALPQFVEFLLFYQ